jgi:DNA repair exonuclease SbcCD ATPase subunit
MQGHAIGRLSGLPVAQSQLVPILQVDVQASGAQACSQQRTKLQEETLRLSEQLKTAQANAEQAVKDRKALKAAQAELTAARKECGDKGDAQTQQLRDAIAASEKAAAELREKLSRASSDKEALSTKCKGDLTKHVKARNAALQELEKARSSMAEAEASIAVRTQHSCIRTPFCRYHSPSLSIEHIRLRFQVLALATHSRSAHMTSAAAHFHICAHRLHRV